jgi:hypothetical protein
MQRAKRYYVIYEDDEWKIKLEKGRVIRTFGSNRQRAISKAKKLGRRNNRPVMVNYKSGATGAEYYSKEEL